VTVLLLPVVTGRLLSYYMTCYVVYISLLVLFLYVYVRFYADEPKPFINVVSGQPLLQMPGLVFRCVAHVEYTSSLYSCVLES